MPSTWKSFTFDYKLGIRSVVAAENTGLAPFWTLVSGYNLKQSSHNLRGWLDYLLHSFT